MMTRQGFFFTRPSVIPNPCFLFSFLSRNYTIDDMRSFHVLLLRGALNFTLLILVLLFCYGCVKQQEKCPTLSVTASLEEGDNQLFLALRNTSACEITVCKRNFYDMVECIDIRRFPDTAEFSQEQIFGKQAPGIKRAIITLDDFTTLGLGQVTRIPLDLRGIAAPCKLGDTVFISAFFKNIDPYLCSKVDVNNSDKATQDYCRLLHVIPTLANHYWSGEIRTPYKPVHLCAFARPKAANKKRSAKVTVIRRSRTHPLNHKVF
jgi:hypothetical protein